MSTPNTPGDVQCPRCRRFWPEAAFRPDYASFDVLAPQARCQDCRDGRKKALRQRAIDFGKCEVGACRKPVHEKYMCLAHFTRSREKVGAYRAKRDGKRLAAKLAAELPLAVEVREACK